MKFEYAQDQDRMAARLRALQSGSPKPLVQRSVAWKAGPAAFRTLSELLKGWELEVPGWYERGTPLLNLIAWCDEHPNAPAEEMLEYVRRSVNASENFRKYKHGAFRRGTFDRNYRLQRAR